MATSSWFSQSGQENNSAVINLTDSMLENDDMEVSRPDVDKDDFSAPDIPRDGPSDRERGEKTEPATALMDAMKTQMAESVWQTGKQQASKVIDLYGNIDLLRPYFDVEPKTLIHRLVLSLLPLRPSSTHQKAIGELYGPLMIVFTLIAILLMGMKDSGHSVREGTLMGSAISIGFGYWLLASGLYYGVSFICNTHISFLQVLSLTGYGMFSFCVVLFLGTTLHNTASHTMFYVSWAVLGGLSALRMIGVYLSRTKGRSHKLTIATTVAVLHLLFLLYLHFAYHKMVEDNSAIKDPFVQPQKFAPRATEHDVATAALPQVKLDLPPDKLSHPEKLPVQATKVVTLDESPDRKMAEQKGANLGDSKTGIGIRREFGKLGKTEISDGIKTGEKFVKQN